MRPKLLLTDISQLMGCTIHNVHMIIKEKNIKTLKLSNRVFIDDPEELKKIIKINIPNKIICMQTAKGGIGKTILSGSILTRLWQLGAKVLAIDLDQQANLTKMLLGNSDKNNKTLIDIFEEKATIKESLQPVFKNFDILPSSIRNSILNQHMISYGLNPVDSISDILSPIRDQYDIILFDCPPAIGHVITSSVYASDLIISPIDPDEDAIDGMYFCWNEVKKINKKSKANRSFKIILNKYDQRTIMSTRILNTLLQIDDLKDFLFETIVGVSQEFTDENGKKAHPFNQIRQGKGANDIHSVVLELIDFKHKNN